MRVSARAHTRPRACHLCVQSHRHRGLLARHRAPQQSETAARGRDWAQGSRVLERPHSGAPDALTARSPAQSTGCLIRVVRLPRGGTWGGGGGSWGLLPPLPSQGKGSKVDRAGGRGWRLGGLGRRGRGGTLPPHSRGPPTRARVQREPLPLAPRWWLPARPLGPQPHIPPSSQSFLS